MSQNFFSKSKYTFIAMGVLSIIIISYLYHLNHKAKSLPIYNPIDINPKLVDESLLNKSKNHTIGDFKLIDQDGNTVTPKDFENKIYVADFFFARCESICPIMTDNMAILQNIFIDEPKLKFISHSVTPIMDSVPVLKTYAEIHGAISGKWHITTGDKKEIYNLARKNYFAVLDEGDGGAQDFIHTEQFILIDTQKRIRGFYDGTDSKEIELLTADIQTLLNEH
ncbi:SCO family protein [Wenyingzhuangia sp. 2_MG-2023]|uniref:SCO family protein n=1 Tax=Wenyingzhuangia sp. 2_MG-2023 TaxID=3062639 RepID=UPI0026E305C6|nr:SCO family protein [Wenyingzhuangia sp. 2_MG-2023]MDO6736993.1 SCO family protein [Wenyingzhuangia sp. 2_MG-2023]